MALMTSLGVALTVVAFVFGALWEQRRMLMEQAITDPLTGAFNRRHVDSCLMTAIERRNRTGEPASLLMLDVDHFKRINDAYGHPAGDEALKRLVALIAGRARKLDVLFRVGGEEFLLLLPGTRYDGAIAVAEHLRAARRALRPDRRAPDVDQHRRQRTAARAVGRRLDRGRRRGRVSSETVRAESRTHVRPAAGPDVVSASLKEISRPFLHK